MDFDGDASTTRLLTLLNVSALKSRKRTWDDDPPAREKLNKRKTARLAEDISSDPGPSISHKTDSGVEDAIGINEDTDNVDLQGMLSVRSRYAYFNARH